MIPTPTSTDGLFALVALFGACEECRIVERDGELHILPEAEE